MSGSVTPEKEKEGVPPGSPSTAKIGNMMLANIIILSVVGLASIGMFLFRRVRK